MKFSPSFELSVLTEESFAEKMPAILRELEQCRQEGTFSGFDGKELYYEYFQTQQSHAAVVIVHGLSEFTGKYYEFAWYLLNQGYDVFLYDQRCHGRSCRLTDRIDLIHVDRFSDYHKDLHCFVQQVVRKATDLPLYLYGHSMGGATAAFYLAHHPETFQKAILSAPMLLPLTGGVPPVVARLGVTVAMLGGDKKKFWQAGEFDPNYTFTGSQDKSYARFLRNKELRLSDPCFQTTPQTLRWVQQSLSLRGKLTSRAFLKKIQVPTLMICGDKETVVDSRVQERFAEKCAHCRRVVLQGVTHNMLWGTEQTVTAVVQQILDHFA